uniref:Rac GTPase-activating protein 1-like n=1 Tax=Phallusia mammillata TaxID=59560 RepID=A0A6F9DQK5_9ASCI|nr:rac GTPase-activating protein 1-like [Phallusia mammillata]
MPIKSVSDKAFCKLSLVNQFDEIVRAYSTLVEGSCEKEFLQFARHFEQCRQKWQVAEQRCMELQERLTKSEAEKNALFIKLKHARRQIEVEMQGRQKAELDRDDLDHQIMLVRELLLSDSSSTATLSEEQQRKLDFLNASRFQSPRSGMKGAYRKLDPIDETGSMLSDYSDISFDVTEDDLDGSLLRNGKKWKRGRMAARRAFENDDETMPKRFRSDAPAPRSAAAHSDSYHNALDNDQSFVLGANESLRCTVDGPATMCIEKLEKSFSRPNPHQGRRRPSREHRRKSATASESETQSSEVETFWPSAPVQPKKTGRKHNLQTKPCVITKETCKPCGKRIQFGKKAVKCVECRLVAHPECEDDIKSFPCEPSPGSPSSTNGEKNTIEDYLASDESPKIPPIIYHTVQEIERRGLSEVGLYRVPGMLRVVKELREKFKGRSIPKLQEVNDIHALCSLVKDFLRVTLKQPIVTFELRPRFIEAALQDDDSSMYQILNELPPANRDTLMFLILHFQRVAETKETRMSVEAVAKAIGPSVVGYSSPEPAMADLQNAAIDQEKVLTKLLLLPADFYAKSLEKSMMDTVETPRKNRNVTNTPETYKESDELRIKSSMKAPESLLGPLGSPRKTPSSSSLAERAKKYLGGTPFGRGKRKETSYFASPSLH